MNVQACGSHAENVALTYIFANEYVGKLFVKFVGEPHSLSLNRFLQMIVVILVNYLLN